MTGMIVVRTATTTARTATPAFCFFSHKKNDSRQRNSANDHSKPSHFSTYQFFAIIFPPSIKYCNKEYQSVNSIIDFMNLRYSSQAFGVNFCCFSNNSIYYQTAVLLINTNNTIFTKSLYFYQ
jgi:hypothetical protein